MSRRRLLRPRDRRALLVGLLVLAPAALFRVGVQPWLEYRAGLRDALVAERDLLSRERAALAEASMNPEREAQLRGELDAASTWLIDASSSIAASGALTRSVTAVGEASGVLIQEVQTRESDGRPGSLQSVAINVRALGDLEGLSRLLHSIENGPLLLVISDLALRPAGVNDGDLERGQLMAFGIGVTGFWKEEVGSQVATASAEVRP